MAQITLQIPDAQVPRVIVALCSSLMVDAVTPVVPTAALAKQVLIDYVKQRVQQYENQQAVAAIAPTDVSTIVS